MKLPPLAGSSGSLQKGSDPLNQTKVYIPLIILSSSDSDSPTVPIKFGYTGSWRRVITPIHIAEGKDRNYYGITTSAGVGTPSGEFHANWGETYPITTRKFNIYEALYNRIERIREWCAQ